MVIPTLRRLGLIIGYEDRIRLSANGELIVLAKRTSLDQGLRVLRVILLEMDSHGPRALAELERLSPWEARDLERFLLQDSRGAGEKQVLERIRDWLRYLAFTGLVVKASKSLELNKNAWCDACHDSDVNSKRVSFATALFEHYATIASRQRGVTSVDIEELRRSLANAFYMTSGAICTEQQFDQLLRDLPKTSGQYAISFGRPMGTEEKLFVMDDKYYQTLSVRFEKGK